ncbi:hypothetical protein [Clostridium sporogenes]|uniref:hypothetical protein n=1 Tax=Clostridium sporogenes TaxID=1509 RepID=UPI00071765E9|nr:hypothetical protein [Clostridium sporogenes]KRU40055.1 hypothetical protein VT94_25320 [Clostridium sporogenes]MBY7065206.1 hypothetical protein [Clostridium sporogenes]MBY7071824.1 hypothetical protein [Clostridium sporogenes]MCW6064724.1 hypothetical protein [Clostridium sporogenes]OQP88547.1 hypothetical protein VT93_0201910 [Clostridium sporogenes]
MIEDKTIAILNCVDDNMDELRVIESICFNTKVLNIKCFNNNIFDDEIVTEIVLDKRRAEELRDSLDEWIKECNNN